MRSGRHRAAWSVIADEALRKKAYGRHNGRGPIHKILAEAADGALEDATEDERKVYKLRYVEGMSSQMASEKLYMSERSYYRTLNRLIRRVEERLLG